MMMQRSPKLTSQSYRNPDITSIESQLAARQYLTDFILNQYLPQQRTYSSCQLDYHKCKQTFIINNYLKQQLTFIHKGVLWSRFIISHDNNIQNTFRSIQKDGAAWWVGWGSCYPLETGLNSGLLLNLAAGILDAPDSLRWQGRIMDAASLVSQVPLLVLERMNESGNVTRRWSGYFWEVACTQFHNK